MHRLSQRGCARAYFLLDALREGCAVVWRVLEALSAKDLESGLSFFQHDCEYRSAFSPATLAVGSTGR